MNRLNPTHNMPRRIGIFGGTFNPIHIGHLQVAEDVRLQFGLDQILFIPSARPPHKTEADLAPARDRLAMVRIALHHQDAMTTSDIEILRGGPSYTIDTLRGLRSTADDGVTFFFMMGADAFFEIHTWKSYRQLPNLAALIVMTRPGQRQHRLPFETATLNYAQRHICERYALSERTGTLKHPEKKSIFLASVPSVAIASTRIRDMIRSGKPSHDWAGRGVSDYIEKKGLYR